MEGTTTVLLLEITEVDPTCCPTRGDHFSLLIGSNLLPIRNNLCFLTRNKLFHTRQEIKNRRVCPICRVCPSESKNYKQGVAHTRDGGDAAATPTPSLLPQADGEDAKQADHDDQNGEWTVAFAEADGGIQQEEERGGRVADAGREGTRMHFRHRVHHDEEDEIRRRADDSPDGGPWQDGFDAFQRIRPDNSAGQQITEA